jgi:hypothetical protein
MGKNLFIFFKFSLLLVIIISLIRGSSGGVIGV